MKMGFRRCFVWGAAWVFLMMLCPAWGAEKTGEDKVAVVNGAVITKGQFDSEFQRAEQVYGMGRALDSAQLADIRTRALENLIERELLYQESQKKGIKVEKALLEEQLAALKGRFPDQKTFLEELKKINLDEAQLRNHMERGLATQRFVEEEVVAQVMVSEKELNDYYGANKEQMKQPEQIRASHILIKVDQAADASEKKKAREKLEKIEAAVKKGEDFGALAKEHSQCPSSASSGDLGFFSRGQMVKPFEDAAFALKPGEVSGIVETSFGYHLIKLQDRRAETTMALEDVRDRLEEHLKQKKVQEEMRQLIARVKGEAKIERFLPAQGAPKE